MKAHLAQMHLLVFVTSLPISLAASNGIEPGVESAMRAGNYAAAESLAEAALRKDKSNSTLMWMAGDAAFMQGRPEAYSFYTRAWLVDLDNAWDATKGDSPFWKALAVSTMVLGAAADYTNAQQGISSSYAADSLESSTKMMGTLEEATGNKDARAGVKQVMRDLKKLAKRKNSSYQIIRPNYWNRVAGAGMARVHTLKGTCNGVRIGAGYYAVSTACLNQFGAPTGVSIDTTLLPEDFSKVVSVTPNGDSTTVSVQYVDAIVATSSWKPSVATSTDMSPQAYGVTWFAPEFNYIIPLFQSCSSARFDDCGDVHENNALLWVKSDNQWKFLGFAGPDGKLLSYK